MEEKILKGFKEHERRVLTPSSDPNEVTIFRCQGCGSLNTDLSIMKFGECWSCGGHRMVGGSPGVMQSLYLQLHLDKAFFWLLAKWRSRKDEAYG